MPLKSRSHAPDGPAASPAPQARIILATIECLERYGVSGTTVRRITEAAGVNIAAINYYFGDKEALLEKALAETLQEALPRTLAEATESVAKQGGNIEAGIRAFFREYLVTAVASPRLTVAHFRAALLEQDYSGRAVAATREFVDGFYRLVSPAMLQRTEPERRLAVIHVWAAIFNLAMLPRLFAVSRESLAGEEMVARLCATLFEAL